MLEELYEQKNALAVRIKELAEEANNKEIEWTEVRETNWNKANDDYNALIGKIGKLERSEEVQKQQEAQGTDGVSAAELASADFTAHQKRKDPDAVNEEDRALALQGWMLARSGKEVTDEQREACTKVRMSIHSPDTEVRIMSTPELMAMREQRATTYTSKQSGYGDTIVPQGFVNNLELALEAFGGVRKVCTILRTATGNALPWPTLDDTNAGELITEYQDSDDSGTGEANLNPSAVTFNAYKISSKLIKVSHELMVDSAFNLVNLIGQLCGERIGRALATYLTTGTGSSQHNGIVTAATAGKTVASTSAITADELIDLFHSVDPAYRSGGFNTGWMMEDATAKVIRKLKDSDGQYVWQAGLQAGMPDVLLGYPVTINQAMATIAANAKTILFGAFKKYVCREVGSVRLRHLLERYAELDLEAFVGFHRSDGDLLDAGTNPVKYILHPAS